MAAPAAEGENLIEQDGDFVGEEPTFALTADGIWMWFGQSYFRVFCLVFSVFLFLNLMRYLADTLARMEGDSPARQEVSEGEGEGEDLEEKMRKARERMQEKHKGDAQAFAEERARQEAEKREERIRSMEAKEAARRGEPVPGRPSGHSPSDYRPNPAFGGGGGGGGYRPRPRRPPGGYGGG